MVSRLLPAVTGLVLLGAVPAHATELVDDDGRQCPAAPHRTIQAGVDAAAPGEQVLVCNGTYGETVRIEGAAKDGVTLIAKTTRRATIRLPAGSPGPIVDVAGADRVSVRRFVLAGPTPDLGPVTCSGTTPGNAVRVGGGAQAVRISEDLVTIPCGVTGIEIGGGASATVVSNTVGPYRFGGIAVLGAGTFATVTGNGVSAAGAAEHFCEQFGIGVFDGAAANVLSNRTAGNRTAFAACPFDDPGQSSPGLLVRHASTGQAVLMNNRSFDNDAGIAIEDHAGAQVERNVVVRNALGGIVSRDNARGGLFRRNDARGNGGPDCSDTTAGQNPSAPGAPWFGTLNTWFNNRGADPVPAGICTPSGA
jgi:hypothetical protein